MGFKSGLYGGTLPGFQLDETDPKPLKRCTDKLSVIAIDLALVLFKDIMFGITLPRTKSKKISWSTLAVRPEIIMPE